jgi:hypothetical protein
MDSNVALLQPVTQEETWSVTTPSPDANGGRQLLMQGQDMGSEMSAVQWESVEEGAHVGGSREGRSRGQRAAMEAGRCHRRPWTQGQGLDRDNLVTREEYQMDVSTAVA